MTIEKHEAGPAATAPEQVASATEPGRAGPDAARGALGNRLLRWLFTDLVWATLPLCVMAMIAFLAVETTTAPGHVLRPFWTQPEWSFASITLLAACLREMLRVKMEVEKANFNSTSAVLGAIIAAIVLNTTLLGFIYAERLGATFNLESVAFFQKVFFGGSIILTIVIFVAEERPWRPSTAEIDRMNKLRQLTDRAEKLSMSIDKDVERLEQTMAGWVERKRPH